MTKMLDVSPPPTFNRDCDRDDIREIWNFWNSHATLDEMMEFRKFLIDRGAATGPGNWPSQQASEQARDTSVACPFCGSGLLIECLGDSVIEAFVKCQKCDARGPTARPMSVNEVPFARARELWNKRILPNKLYFVGCHLPEDIKRT